ncbi:hypothetical protein AVEN_220529-1 [Araneus ventricosus]|uniref:Uncharacterized protein n=1 Tax=Araneus ventricosus TaxID=182803 RepID=A0A4Y2U2A8_ARAVE|nr:hypothetical protein AVEN_163964-1 [Araneus ventricosus]GBO05800.1 hypothetical protein AVEN_220529-1 [Araneus ventricosus]
MSTIGSICEFDASNPISWDNYAEQLKNFLEANEITDAEKKRAVLLSVRGIKSLSVLRLLLAPETPSTKSYEDLIKVSKEHFAPTSETCRRFQFHKRMQHNIETVSYKIGGRVQFLR